MAVALLLASASVAPGRAGAQELTEQRRIEVARRLQEAAVVVYAGRSNGSGFVASDERWIVTNAHVVQGFERRAVRIRFGDGTQLAGRVIAFDPSHDLAIIQCEGQVPSPPLRLGDSDRVVVGQTVLAFGSPFGLDGTLTQGIVSARRDLPAIGGGAVRGLIQTDATINPGNSGGPLVNATGEVIGVNTAILSRTGGSHGIGFAVPSSYVRELLGQTRDYLRREREAVARGQQQPDPPGGRSGAGQAATNLRGLGAVWLGILGDDFRAGNIAGVRVQQVLPNSPASRAGLLGAADPPPAFVNQLGIPWTGYIILALDGEPVRSMSELQRRLRGRRPGETAKIYVTVGGVVNGEAAVELAQPPANVRRR